MGRIIDIEHRIDELEEQLGSAVIFWDRKDFEFTLLLSPDNRVRNNLSVYYLMALEQLDQEKHRENIIKKRLRNSASY